MKYDIDLRIHVAVDYKHLGTFIDGKVSGIREAATRRAMASAAERYKGNLPIIPRHREAALHLASGGQDAKWPPWLRHRQAERHRRGRAKRASWRPTIVGVKCAVAEEGHPDVLVASVWAKG